MICALVLIAGVMSAASSEQELSEACTKQDEGEISFDLVQVQQKLTSKSVVLTETCPDGWSQIGQIGDDVPDWGLSTKGNTATSMVDCALQCAAHMGCGSFEFTPSYPNACALNAYSDADASAQTGTWLDVITCKKQYYVQGLPACDGVDGATFSSNYPCLCGGLSAHWQAECGPFQFCQVVGSNEYGECSADPFMVGVEELGTNLGPSGEEKPLTPQPGQVNLVITEIKHNNLGGMGPDGAAENMRFGTATAHPSDPTRTIDLIVTSNSPYNPKNVNNNGLYKLTDSSPGVPQINVECGYSVELKFTFVDSEDTESLTPVVLPYTYLSFFDFDHSVDQVDYEMLVIDEYHTIVAAETIEFYLSLNPITGQVVINSTNWGVGCDNVQDPNNLEDVVDCYGHSQSKRAVMIGFYDQSSAILTVSAGNAENPAIGCDHGRNVQFSGFSEWFNQNGLVQIERPKVEGNTTFYHTQLVDVVPPLPPYESGTIGPFQQEATTVLLTTAPPTTTTAPPTTTLGTTRVPTTTAPETTTLGTTTVPTTTAPGTTAVPTTTAPETTTPWGTTVPTTTVFSPGGGAPPSTTSTGLFGEESEPTTPKAAVVSAKGDPHMVNVRGEKFDINQPGDYTLLRVPQNTERAALLELRASIRPSDKPCGQFITRASLTGGWLGDSEVEVVASSTLSASAQSQNAFGVRTGEGSGKAWRFLKELNNTQEVVSSNPSEVDVEVTMTTEPSPQNSSAGAFSFHIGKVSWEPFGRPAGRARCDGAALLERAVSSPGACQEACSRERECMYATHWMAGNSTWCRLSTSQCDWKLQRSGERFTTVAKKRHALEDQAMVQIVQRRPDWGFLNIQIAHLSYLGHSQIGGLLGHDKHDSKIGTFTDGCKSYMLRHPRHMFDPELESGIDIGADTDAVSTLIGSGRRFAGAEEDNATHSETSPGAQASWD